MLKLLILQVVLIALNAVFACAEIAVLSINEMKLERLAERGDKRAQRLSRLTREPARFLATIQVAITLSGFLGSAFAADNFSEPLVEWVLGLGVNAPRATLDAVAVVLITLILSYFTLVFGELVPKRVAMKRAEQLALGISGLVGGISVAFKPLVWLLTVSTNTVLRLIGIDPSEADEEVGEEEIRMMVDAGSEKGSIDAQEKEFIQNVFEFNDLTAEEIAVHRTDVVLLWMDDPMEEWARTIRSSRHTLYPICKDSPDKIVGILNAKEYFRMEDHSREAVMHCAVREPFFIPETMKADVLFREMKRSRNVMAVVLDEYGGMEGIITMNDLIEELVGDLGEETPSAAAAEPRVERIGENTWAVTGNVELDDLQQALETDLALEDAETITGLVFSVLNKIPADGEQHIDLEFRGLQIRVSHVKDHQVARATVTKPVQPAAQA